MKNPDLSGEAHIPDELIKLGTFEWPRSEARQTLGHLFEKIKSGFVSDAASNAVDDQNLERISDESLKADVTGLLKTTLDGLLDQHYLDWAKRADGTPNRRAFIHPPTTKIALDDWAKRHGFPVLDPNGTLADISGATCIVIPKLETFFSRDYDQMAQLFDLFTDLAQYDGKVLVGCNSWAWRFLKQFDDAHLLFEDVSTFPTFDANALAAILQRALSNTDHRNTFTSVESGKPIFMRDDDGTLEDPYLNNLAGRSLGHPWVAVEMFFRGIAKIKDTDTAQGEDETWVDLPASCSLPAFGADALLFALQALMIHGPRPIDELSALLAHRVPNGTWTELARAGFVDIHDGTAHCTTRSYPDIRSELGAAGFNLDEL